MVSLSPAYFEERSMERAWHDDNGIPPRFAYAEKLIDRQVQEMLGLAKGIICDGVVNDAEVVALRQWFLANPDVTMKYPGNHLAARVMATFEDGIVDEDERAELTHLLTSLVGEPEIGVGNMNNTTRLAFNNPLPFVLFDGREFVFTGTCAYGTRKKCEAEVAARGGRCSKTVTSRCDFLVVGLIASPSWTFSTHGRKIEEAVESRSQGHRLAIVPEEHWIEALQLDAH
jgi:NAD-dependent DNA ligase